jgi:hypothetical protein
MNATIAHFTGAGIDGLETWIVHCICLEKAGRGAGGMTRGMEVVDKK